MPRCEDGLPFLAQALDGGDKFVLHFCVPSGLRLIQQQNSGVCVKPPRDGNALPLPARQIRHVLI